MAEESSINKLLTFIKTRVSLTEEDVRLIEDSFKPILFPKNRIIEEQQEIPKYIYYIISGYLRLFHYNDHGDEVTSHINCPPGFITSYSSFINQKTSTENLESITESELLRITKKDLDRLTQRSIAMKDFSISVFQQSIEYNENRSKELATLTAEQRYRKLMDTFPDILQNVPIAYIASFLGMKPESLSRIRRKVAGQHD